MFTNVMTYLRQSSVSNGHHHRGRGLNFPFLTKQLQRRVLRRDHRSDSLAAREELPRHQWIHRSVPLLSLSRSLALSLACARAFSLSFRFPLFLSPTLSHSLSLSLSISLFPSRSRSLSLGKDSKSSMDFSFEIPFLIREHVQFTREWPIQPDSSNLLEQLGVSMITPPDLPLTALPGHNGFRGPNPEPQHPKPQT